MPSALGFSLPDHKTSMCFRIQSLNITFLQIDIAMQSYGLKTVYMPMTPKLLPSLGPLCNCHKMIFNYQLDNSTQHVFIKTNSQLLASQTYPSASFFTSVDGNLIPPLEQKLLAPLFCSHPTSNPLANPVGPVFEICLEPTYFSPSLALPPLSKPPSSLIWVISIAWYLIPLLLPLAHLYLS